MDHDGDVALHGVLLRLAAITIALSRESAENDGPERGYGIERFKVHFIPTSSSWLNLVERWFGDLTGKAVRRGSFASVPDLVVAIEAFIATWNRDPKPFIWQARAEDILAKIERCRRRLEAIQPGCTVSRVRKKAA